jgi:hypothetical protein
MDISLNTVAEAWVPNELFSIANVITIISESTITSESTCDNVRSGEVVGDMHLRHGCGIRSKV